MLERELRDCDGSSPHMLWRLSKRIQQRTLSFSVKFLKQERSSSLLHLLKQWKRFVRSIAVGIPQRLGATRPDMPTVGRVQAAIESIKEAFGSDPPNLAGARILAVKLKYWQGLEEAAKDWTPKL